MVLNITSTEELEKIIKSERIVLLLAYDSRSPYGRYVSSLIDDVAFVVEPVLPVVKLDIADNKKVLEELGLRSVPRLRLYLEGRIIWEQIGFFMNYSSDKYAIRKGVLNALRNYGLRPRELGFKLTLY